MMPHYDAITSTESGMNPCQTGVWWERFAFFANDQGGGRVFGHPQRRIPLSLIALSENFIRLLIRTSLEKITCDAAFAPRFPAVASFWPLIGRSPQLTSTTEHRKTIPYPLNSCSLPSTPFVF